MKKNEKTTAVEMTNVEKSNIALINEWLINPSERQVKQVMTVLKRFDKLQFTEGYWKVKHELEKFNRLAVKNAKMGLNNGSDLDAKIAELKTQLDVFDSKRTKRVKA